MDAWSPDQYHKFVSERSRPFFDLLDLVSPVPGGRAVDLGCGTGELTRTLHEKVAAGETLGVDSSARMLEKARAFQVPLLDFAQADIATWSPQKHYDVIFSNAALQWIDDHPGLLARLVGALAPGGQLAVQVPGNHNHLSHRLVEEVVMESPFREALGGYVRHTPVLTPEHYASLLFELGLKDAVVRLNVYGHVLSEAAELLEWVKGTTLTPYASRLPAALYSQLVERYRERLRQRLGNQRPYYYTFNRILMRGARP